MNRQQVIEKIQSMLKLQESTDFEGEAQAAANLIDKLCKQYEINLDDATKVQILDESFHQYKRMNTAYALLLNAVAAYYDAKAYVKNGDVKSLQIIGSEAQQIQVKIYFEFLYEVMEREANKAYQAEKLLDEMMGKTTSRSFKTNFRKSFVTKVQQRLSEMKDKEHEHAGEVRNTLSKMRLSKGKKFTGAVGAGAYAGADAGSSVSLNRQTSSGHKTYALRGA